MRKLMWFTIGFAAATLLCACVYGGWLLPAAAGAGVVSLVLVGLCWKFPALKRPAAVAVGCVVGLGWFAVYNGRFLAAARAADGSTAAVTITVSDYSEQTNYGSAAEGTVTLDGRTYRVKFYLKNDASLAPGDTVSGSFRLRFTTDGGSEDATYHRTEGIFLLAYQTGQVTLTTAERVPARLLPAVWRRAIVQRLQALFAEDASGFACALLVGDRSGIDYETSTAFKVSGISHIIAVSGLHVSIVFGLMYTLMGRKRVLSCLLGIPALFLFAAVAGFTPSITRACVMQSLMLIATLTDQEYDPPTALAFAVLAMLVWNPLTVLSISFQLSVGCMTGIFLFSEKIQLYLSDPAHLGSAKGKGIGPACKRWLITSVSITLSAMVVTTPLVAYYFGTVSLIGVLTNLLTLWVIVYIFYGIVLCLALSLISMGAGSAAAWVTAWPIRYVVNTAKALSQVPLAAVYTQSIYIVVWLVGAYLLLAVFLLQRKKRPAQLFLCFCLSLCVALALSWAEPLADECRMTVLDVGQGQCILLQSGGKTFLVDCGGDSDTEAADLAAETLLSQGISRLDGIILTHYDADHSGGLAYLLTRVSTDLLLMPDVLDENGVGAALAAAAGDGQVVYVDSDLILTYADTEIEVFGPISYRSGNESSLCVLFRTENCAIMLTGDRGALGELMLLYTHTLPKVDVLVVGHHGSASSTGQALLDALEPDIAVISVGADNSYGHPTQAVLERLAECGCTVYRTDLQGTILIRR
ncbi:MAG: DNA internalization-related competence protein ComEC/Rec2 [Firmicutes bacterium]|nr:DNA internalization-related competence protein ComEC/Rec2 [Bacillota bacterium]